jgi:hypothetical protein
VTDVLLKLRAYKKSLNTNQSSHYDWMIPEHYLNKLTLDQLNLLGSKDTIINNDVTFRKVQFHKTHYVTLVLPQALLKQLRETRELTVQRQVLKDLIVATERDTVRNNRGLLSAINEALLNNGYEMEFYEIPIFLAYLRSPINRHSQTRSEYYSKTSYHDSHWRSFINYQAINMSLPGSDAILEAYLDNTVKTGDLIQDFSEFFNPTYLQQVLARNQVLAGGSLDSYKTLYGESAANEIETRKNLNIARRNKRRFGRGEEVKIVLEVKNIPELTYKIFEIDTLTYYKQNKAEINDQIDLDGLVPETIYKVAYTQAKQHQHEETFEFPEIARRDAGVFIVEFVGAGMSSRVVIKKGSLNLLVQRHFQGYKLYVINENKEVCTGPKTGLIIDGKMNRVNEQGFILMPFNDANLNTKPILTHNGFGFLGSLAMATENYTLRNAVLFNEESIVNGRKLKLILKNKLFLNDTPITLQKFEEFSGEIQLTNYEEITNYKHFKDIKLKDDEDHCLELIVPPNLRTLVVSVTGRLKTLAGKEVTLSASETITIQRNQGTLVFITCLLNRNPEEGYYVQLRGKNGEPIPNRQVIVELQKSYGSFNFTKELFTDAQGKCVLGHLAEFRLVSLRSNNGSFNQKTFAFGEGRGPNRYLRQLQPLRRRRARPSQHRQDAQPEQCYSLSSARTGTKAPS